MTHAPLPKTIDDLVLQRRLPEPIYVTQPTLPPLEDYHELLEQIWERKWLTNDGVFHQELERRLADYLGVQHISLFCNGTMALWAALQALDIHGGEVITTPFTFPATAHVLELSGVRPVFCDIDRDTFNLDPNKLQALIGPNTRAILPVHVFGTPCDVDAIQAIADAHDLPVIYDAAHAFGVRYRGRPLAEFGDMAMLSFHATKLFSTAEGGALVAKSAEQKERIRLLKNFGIAGEETVLFPGMNGKMNELQAALGLLALEHVDDEIAARRQVDGMYRERLSDVAGISLLLRPSDLQPNYAYMPILIDAADYGTSRDVLYDVLGRVNVFTRKYFYPLCSRYPCYAGLPSAAPDRLPVAEGVAGKVLCLPLYGSLRQETVEAICALVRDIHATCTKE